MRDMPQFNKKPVITANKIQEIQAVENSGTMSASF